MGYCDNTCDNRLLGDTVDEEEIKKLKKELLRALILARKLAEQDKTKEALDIFNSDEFLTHYRALFPGNATNPFDKLRNAIVYMCTVIEGSENIKKRATVVKEAGKKDSLRLIAEISEELED